MRMPFDAPAATDSRSFLESAPNVFWVDLTATEGELEKLATSTI